MRHTEIGTRTEDPPKEVENEYPRGRMKASRMWCPGSQVKGVSFGNGENALELGSGDDAQLWIYDMNH